MSLVRGLSFFGLCFAFVVIALGAWTRLVDAGLGCPDWPGCYGFVVFPTTEAEILIAEQRYPQFPYDIDKAIPEVVHSEAAVAGCRPSATRHPPARCTRRNEQRGAHKFHAHIIV